MIPVVIDDVSTIIIYLTIEITINRMEVFVELRIVVQLFKAQLPYRHEYLR